jgi:hypothetical protein
MKMNGETRRGRHILIDHPWSYLGIADRLAFAGTTSRSTWATKVTAYSMQKFSEHAAAMLLAMRRCIVQYDRKEPAYAIR